MMRSATARTLTGLIVVVALFFGEGFAWARQNPSPNPSPKTAAPWSVQVARNKYYTGLDAARTEAIRQLEAEGLTLSYHADGTVVQDAALEKATNYYDQQRQKLLNEVKSDKRRDVELENLRVLAKVPQGRDTGTGTGDPNYSGALSDRDVTLQSKAEVERISVAAEKNGYHCVQGFGYLKIMELDTVLWDPSSVGKGGKILQHDDPEVVLGYESPSVVQQIKKVERDLRQEIPLTTQEQHELVSSIAKAASKAEKSVDPDHTGLVMSESERQRFEQLKSRRLTPDDLMSTFDRPEAKAEKLREFKREAVRSLEKCDPLQREQRKTAADEFKSQRTELATALLAENDPVKQLRLREQISDLDDELKAIQKAETLDRATKLAITRKNPKLAENLNWTERNSDRTNPLRPGETVRNARLLKQAQEERPRPQDAGTSTARETWQTATELNKTFTKVLGSPLLSVFAKVVGIPPIYVDAARTISKTTKQIDQVLLDPVNKGIHSEGFDYETGEGMKEYIRSEIQAVADAGYDVTTPRWQELIRRKAIVRATARGTYEGSKSLPGLGKIVQGLEDTYKLTEATVGLPYDTWKSQQTIEMNRFQQEGQLEKAILQAIEARDRLRTQMSAASKTVTYTEQLEAHLPGLYADVAALQQQIKDRTLLLEQLASRANPDATKLDAIDADALRKLGSEITALTALAQAFIQDCDTAITRAKGRQVTREVLAEEQAALGRRMMNIDTEYVRLSTLLDRAGNFVRLIQDPQQARQIYEALMLDYGQAAALAGMAEDIASKLERNRLLYKDLLRCFQDERQRMLRACDYFVTRPVGDENLQAKLSRIRGEITGYSIQDYQLEDTVEKASDIKREAVWLRRTVDQAPPPPPQAKPLSPALIAEADRIQLRLQELEQPAAGMTVAVETARDRFRQLRELSSTEVPVFRLAATEITESTYAFALTARSLPTGAKILYRWDFGDGVNEGSRELTRQHAFAKPGKYTVVVRAFEETPQFSVELGEARVTVDLTAIPATIPPVASFPGALEVWASLSLDDGLDVMKGKNSITRSKVGQFHTSSALKLRYVPGTREIHADWKSWILLRLSDDAFPRNPGTWEFNATGQAAGTFDPLAGTLRLTTQNVKWTETVPVEALMGVSGTAERLRYSSEQRASAMTEAHQFMGAAPDQLTWQGTIDGTIDWKNFRGGGRLEINKIVSGTWQIDKGVPYDVTLADDMQTPDGTRRPLLQLYPNEAAAKRAFLGSNTPLRFGGRTLTDFGDEAIWHPQRGIIIRIGRWHLNISRPPYRSSNPELFRPLLEKVQAFITESGLETAIPEQPEP